MTRLTRHKRSNDKIKSTEKRTDQSNRCFTGTEIFFDRLDEHSGAEHDTIDHHVTAEAGKLLENFVKFPVFSSLADPYHDNPSKPAIGWNDDRRFRRLRHFIDFLQYQLQILPAGVVVQVPIFGLLSITLRRHQLDCVLRWHLIV